MIRLFSILIVGGASWVVMAAEPLAPDVYGALPYVDHAELSPDGTKMAFIRNDDGVPAAVVVDLATGKPKGVALENLTIRRLDWSDGNHLLAYTSDTVPLFNRERLKYEFRAVLSIDTRDMTKIVPLMTKTKTLSFLASLTDIRAAVGDDLGSVIMSASSGYTFREDLYLVDGATGVGTILNKGLDRTLDWVVAPNGHVIDGIDSRRSGRRFDIVKPVTPGVTVTEWQEPIEVTKDLKWFNPLGMAADGNGLIVVRDGDDGRGVVQQVSLETGALGPVLFESPTVDIDGVLIDRHSGAAIGVGYVEDADEQFFFENFFQGVRRAVAGAMPGQRVYLTSWDRDRKKFLIFAESNTLSGAYFLFDVETGILTKVFDQYPSITRDYIAPAKAFTFEARDGLKLQAYLTTPPGVEAKGLPLVVLPHGGPAARDKLGFDWMTQFIASRGYAVLQVNFRGSDGYGDKFVEAGFGEWGGKMQDDVTDGVQRLIDDGVVDRERMCIAGVSYGGYSALAGVTVDPDLYRCAVSVSGVSVRRACGGGSMIATASTVRTTGIGGSSWEWEQIIRHVYRPLNQLRRLRQMSCLFTAKTIPSYPWIKASGCERRWRKPGSQSS